VRTRRNGFGVFAVMLVLLVGALGAQMASGAGKFALRIGSKNFTEQFVLAEMYAQALEAKGYQVERSINLGGTLIAHEALRTGKIDMYPEYTGTALKNMVKASAPNDPDVVYKTVKEFYEKNFGLTWLDQSKMNNTYILVLRPETAQRLRLKTNSDLAKVASQLVIGTGPEWGDREDGLPGLKRVYGIVFKEWKPMNIGLRYQALQNRQIDVVNGYSTDGEISALKLATLVDDKAFWPPFHVAPVIRKTIAANYPGVVQVLNAVTALLTDTGQSDLNWRVDGNKQEPRDVARDFLRQHGLVK
jgi:osmoprotectant transport system substrate-binding protein